MREFLGLYNQVRQDFHDHVPITLFDKLPRLAEKADKERNPRRQYAYCRADYGYDFFGGIQHVPSP